MRSSLLSPRIHHGPERPSPSYSLFLSSPILFPLPPILIPLLSRRNENWFDPTSSPEFIPGGTVFWFIAALLVACYKYPGTTFPSSLLSRGRDAPLTFPARPWAYPRKVKLPGSPRIQRIAPVERKIDHPTSSFFGQAFEFFERRGSLESDRSTRLRNWDSSNFNVETTNGNCKIFLLLELWEREESLFFNLCLIFDSFNFLFLRETTISIKSVISRLKRRSFSTTFPFFQTIQERVYTCSLISFR